MHLVRWHEMVIAWHDGNMSGKKTDFLPEGFNWRTTPELNFEMWNEYQSVSLDEAKRLVKKTHQEVMDIIKSHNNDDLFKKGTYDWTGSSSLGSYLVSATSSHYDWAMKTLRKIH